MLQRLEVAAKKHSLLLVLGACAVCYVQPSIGLTLRHTQLGHVPLAGWSYGLLTLALSLIMLSASVQCQLGDFVAVTRSRAKAPFLASVYLAGPLLGLAAGIAALLTLRADVGHPISLGLVLLGLMPIAMTSAAWVRMNGGNVPLLLGAIVVTNAIAVPVVPVVLRRIARVGDVALGAGPVVQQLTLAILVPVLVGITLRSVAPRLALRSRPALSLLSTASLLVSIGSTVSASRPHIEANVSAIAAAAAFTLAFNVALYFAGVRLVRLATLGRSDAVTVLFASGMRNMGAAMVVAAIAFPNEPLIAIPAALFSISQQLLGGAMTSLLARWPALVDADRDFDDVPPARGPMRSRPQTAPSVPPLR